ncbi:DUF2835 family protein [Pseudomonas sp. 2FG]|uniref:DUF2835 family protein n=1 Tax=Pseudomonas sp. 2FG TaxID=2502191 RepID=UPI0010F8E2DF
MPSPELDIALSAEPLRGLSGPCQVFLNSRDGRRVSLPVQHLRSFLTHGGVYASFGLGFNVAGELLSRRRVGRSVAVASPAGAAGGYNRRLTFPAHYRAKPAHVYPGPRAAVQTVPGNLSRAVY